MSFAMAYWMFINPTTFNSMAILLVYSFIVSKCIAGMLMGGITQAESPEWTPANSICSMTAGTKASVPSEMASASASMAFSKNLSIRIGRSGDTSTAADT